MRLEASGGNNRRALPLPLAGEGKRIRGQTDSIKNHPALDPVTRPSSAHPSSALSTSARDGPACPSSDGGDRRCCPLPPPARRRLSPAQCRPHFPYGGPRTA